MKNVQVPLFKADVWFRSQVYLYSMKIASNLCSNISISYKLFYFKGFNETCQVFFNRPKNDTQWIWAKSVNKKMNIIKLWKKCTFLWKYFNEYKLTIISNFKPHKALLLTWAKMYWLVSDLCCPQSWYNGGEVKTSFDVFTVSKNWGYILILKNQRNVL